MYDRILIPVDGSECGRVAATYGFAFASASDAAVDVVHVVDTTIGTIGARMSESERRDHGERILESTVELAAEFDCPVETHIREGSPGTEIVASGTEHDADLIVMGRQGHRNLRERLLGGVTEAVIHHAEQSVLVVPRETESTTASIDRILVPTDGSENAAIAAVPAAHLATAFEAELFVLTAIDVQSAGGGFDAGGVTEEFVDQLADEGEAAVADLAERLRDRASTATVETIVRRGDPHEVIATCADESDVDLLVMGSHGRTGLKRQLVGSVTDRVLRVADTPALVVAQNGE